jgi:hypothetical protein
LLIIVRVARGRSITHEWSSGRAAALSTVVFSGTTLSKTEEIKLEPITGLEQDSAQMLSGEEEVA